MKRFLYIIILFLLLTGTVFSDITQVGTTSNNFLKILPPAKAAAMGEAYIVLGNDIHSLQYNPAGLAKAFTSEISFTHIEWFQDIKYENINITMPIIAGAISCSLNWLHMDAMTKTITDPLNPDLTTGFDELYEFSPFSVYGSVGFSKKFTDHLFIGSNLKILNYAVDPEDPNGAAFSFMLDSGFLYDMPFLPGTSAALVFRNIGPATSYLGEGYGQPINIRGGIGYGGKFYGVEADVEYANDNDINFYLGGSLTLMDIFALRAGFKGGVISQPTFGGGVNYNRMSIDYAYVPYSDEDLGTTHRVTLTYKFGAPSAGLKMVPQAFSPNGDKYYDYSFASPDIISKERVSTARLEIYDAFNNLVDSVRVKDMNKIYWSGINDMGMTAPDGNYFAALKLKYTGGIDSASNMAPVAVDTTPPDMYVDANPKMVKPGTMTTLVVPVNFSPSAQDIHGIGAWKLIIREKETGNVFRTFQGRGEPPLTLTWDGTDNTGVNTVSTGTVYTYTFYSADRLNNWGRTMTREVKVLLREIVINLAADTLFDPGKADVKISIYKDLKKIADRIKQYKNMSVIVEGHTDNRPIKSARYRNNQELSEYRAKAVIKFFSELFNIDEGKFTPVGMGAKQPVASNDTAEGRKRNRRVTIRMKASTWE